MLKDTIRNFFKKKVYQDPLDVSRVDPSSVRAGAVKPKQEARQHKVYEMPCRHCHNPMPIVNGQEVFTHRACRKAYRQSQRAKLKYAI